MSRLTEWDKRIAGVISPLSGTAAKILCIFFWATVGRSFTGQDMADMLGVSANTISPAMRQLTRLGYLQYNGKQYGWSLMAEYRQMQLPELIQENLDNPKIFGLTPPLVVSLGSDQDQELDLPTYPTTAVNPKIFGLTQESGNAEVLYWLDYGGIDRGTPSWKLLVAEITSPEFVKAHALQVRCEHRAWEKAGKSSREPGTGLLVYRLKEGLKGERPTPPMRCEECLRVERECRCNGRGLAQRIPDDLKDIIKR